MRGVERIFIEERPLSDMARLYVFNEESYYTISSGVVVQNKKPEDLMSDDNMYLFEAPLWFLKGLMEHMTKHLESKGGISADQLNKGRIDRFDSEVIWLRGLLEKQLK